MELVFLAFLVWCAGWWINARLANGPRADTRAVGLLVPVAQHHTLTSGVTVKRQQALLV